MVQILASILFFYVFILAAVALTIYIVTICLRFLRDTRKSKSE